MTVRHHYLQFADEAEAIRETAWTRDDDGNLITKGVDYDISPITGPPAPLEHDDDDEPQPLPGYWMLLLAPDDKGLGVYVRKVGKVEGYVSYATEGDK